MSITRANPRKSKSFIPYGIIPASLLVPWIRVAMSIDLAVEAVF